MRFIFDFQDEQDILKQMLSNRNKAESMRQICMRKGRVKQAAKWAKSEQQVDIKITLLEHVFQHKN